MSVSYKYTTYYLLILLSVSLIYGFKLTDKLESITYLKQQNQAIMESYRALQTSNHSLDFQRIKRSRKYETIVSYQGGRG